MKWNVLGLRWHANVEELDGNVFELVEISCCSPTIRFQSYNSMLVDTSQ